MAPAGRAKAHLPGRLARARGSRLARAARLLCAGVLASGIAGSAGAQEAPQAPPEAPARVEAVEPAPVIVLAPGQIQTVRVANVTRVAIGDPEIVDVSILSPQEILLKGLAVGSTDLIIWDARGQRSTPVSVLDPTSETVATEIEALLRQLHLTSVQVQRRLGKVLLIGQVSSDEEMRILEEVTRTSRGRLVNLVGVAQPPPPPAKLAALVRLAVQVIEVNRTDLERLGVKWAEGITFTEPQATDLTGTTALMRFGTSLTRGSVSATLNALVRQNRARVLAEPKLVTASGKEASSFIGVEVPILQATTSGVGSGAVSASVDFRETGVLLKMTPTVTTNQSDKRITTVVEAEVSDIDSSVSLQVPVGAQTVAVPGFSVRKANTEVTTGSGETIVIAGLLKASNTSVVDQVPGLGGMPVLGRLFRSPQLEDKRMELVIAITPELMGDEQADVDRTLALEQALSVAEVTASVDDPKLRYALQIQDRIARAMRYPSRERETGLEGRVKLRLHLFADGTLGRAMVSESSGTEALDLEALKAAESQAPYPAFPAQVAERELWLDVPVIFRL